MCNSCRMYEITNSNIITYQIKIHNPLQSRRGFFISILHSFNTICYIFKKITYEKNHFISFTNPQY